MDYQETLDHIAYLKEYRKNFIPKATRLQNEMLSDAKDMFDTIDEDQISHIKSKIDELNEVQETLSTLRKQGFSLGERFWASKNQIDKNRKKQISTENVKSNLELEVDILFGEIETFLSLKFQEFVRVKNSKLEIFSFKIPDEIFNEQSRGHVILIAGVSKTNYSLAEISFTTRLFNEMKTPILYYNGTTVNLGYLERGSEKTTAQIRYFNKQLPELKKKQKYKDLRIAALTAANEQRSLGSSHRSDKNFGQQLAKNKCCPYCDVEFATSFLDERIHLDHIYPVSRGGRSTNDNMVFVCLNCNVQKSNKTLSVFCNDANLDLTSVTKSLLHLNKNV